MAAIRWITLSLTTRRNSARTMSIHKMHLLHLKLALIEQGNFNNLFTMFGEGSHQGFRAIYASVRKNCRNTRNRFGMKKFAISIRIIKSNPFTTMALPALSPGPYGAICCVPKPSGNTFSIFSTRRL
ncbi:MAG: hypothetical protein R3F37_00685 [Candidatus Competibacteraceae bacterium]